MNRIYLIYSLAPLKEEHEYGYIISACLSSQGRLSFERLRKWHLENELPGKLEEYRLSFAHPSDLETWAKALHHSFQSEVFFLPVEELEEPLLKSRYFSELQQQIEALREEAQEGADSR